MIFPSGPFINFSALFIGGTIGACLTSYIPDRVKHALPMSFGLASIGIGIIMLLKHTSMPPVILAFIIGVFIGEVVNIESYISKLCLKLKALVGNHLPEPEGLNHDEFLEKFVGISLLFCMSGMGIFGALNEGFTGETQILQIKAILDFFTAAIFASSLGYSIAFLGLPMLVIQTTLFFTASIIMSVANPQMIGDFSALGGLIMIATGFRISGIKSFAVANMLPGLLLALPFSWIWQLLFQ